MIYRSVRLNRAFEGIAKDISRTQTAAALSKNFNNRDLYMLSISSGTFGNIQVLLLEFIRDTLLRYKEKKTKKYCLPHENSYILSQWLTRICYCFKFTGFSWVFSRVFFIANRRFQVFLRLLQIKHTSVANSFFGDSLDRSAWPTLTQPRPRMRPKWRFGRIENSQKTSGFQKYITSPEENVAVED